MIKINLKRIVSVLIVIVFIFGLTSCKEDEPIVEENQVPAPTNLEIGINSKNGDTGWILTWDEVPGAYCYYIIIEGKTYRTKSIETQYDLSDKLYFGKNYKIGVQTIFLSEEDETKGVPSEITEIEYTTSNTKVCSKLQYNKLDDGTYEVTAQNTDYKYLEGEVLIPDYYNGVKVTSIADRAFIRVDKTSIGIVLDERENTVTKSIILSKYITKINPSAFAKLNELEKIEITNGVITIPRTCFAYCLKLKEVILPDSVKIIEDGAFYGIESITINYRGTKEDFGKVVLGNGYKMDSAIITVKCNDGEIILK